MSGVFEKLRRNRRNIHQLRLIKMNTRSILAVRSRLIFVKIEPKNIKEAKVTQPEEKSRGVKSKFTSGK